MTVRSTVSSDQVRDALLLPVSALFYQANKTIAYQCDTGAPIAIKQGRHNEDWVEILDGISEGERLRVSAPNKNT